MSDFRFGTLGQPAPTNNPGARDNASTWVDSGGNLWLFGGHGIDPKLQVDYAFNDLWKFSPSTDEWTWMSGSNTDQGATCVLAPNSPFLSYCGYAGTYGTLGTAYVDSKLKDLFAPIRWPSTWDTFQDTLKTENRAGNQFEALGKRFFSDGASLRELLLVGAKAGPSWIVISTYRPRGRTDSFDDAAG